MNPSQLVAEYFRCPTTPGRVVSAAKLDGRRGYFHFGRDAICYGRLSGATPASTADGITDDLLPSPDPEGLPAPLPFDAAEVIDNLRYERYVSGAPAGKPAAPEVVRKAYYFLRPLLPVGLRRQLQRRSLKGWERIAFPEWPLDSTVDRLHRRLLALEMRASGVRRLPFVWFWPDGYSSCAIMTHDVETADGRDYCPRLMDLDDSFGIKSSFQFVPEDRYALPSEIREQVRARGFEFNIHDLNHDGHLFANHDEFIQRAKRINRYARAHGARGFRSAVLYRNADWYGEFEFSYDMSIPNVGHLEPQRGGCCTVMPYFIGGVLELPLTTSEDYTLFHVLGDYSIDLWKRQIGMVVDAHGLISVNAHPDYLIREKARTVYMNLLDCLSGLRAKNRIWFTLPGEVDRWWRQRRKLGLVYAQGAWQIAGAGAERARVAHAVLAKGGDTVEYDLA